MEQRIYHGELTPDDAAQALCARFTRGSLIAQQLGEGDKVVVQVATRPLAASGGQTALTIMLHKVEDGLGVQIGKQNWLGVAASLGMTALSVWRNPLNLLGRLDDLAQDIENLQLIEEAWQVLNDTARLRGATLELSERLRRLVCEYCQTANPVGEASCLACGAPMGEAQPRTCGNCGFVVRQAESACPNCGRPL